MWGPWSPELMGDLNRGKGAIWKRGLQTPFQKMNSPEKWSTINSWDILINES